MSVTLKETITEDMKSAMRAKDAARLSAIRMLTAAIKQKEVDERIEVTDAQVVAIVEKMIKQRRDAVAQFEAGQREDLAAKERFEIGVIEAYLPKRLAQDEIERAVLAAISAAGATGPQDMGKVMSALKSTLAGRADMGAVSAAVKHALTR